MQIRNWFRSRLCFCSFDVLGVVNVTLCRISRGSIRYVHKQLNRMMSRLHRVTACLRGKFVSQHACAGSTLKGLQQLCTWPAEPSQDRTVHSQTTDLERSPQQTSRTVSGDAAAISPAVKHKQPSMMPNWSDSQQATEAVRFTSAKYMSHYIKEQWQLAAQSVRHSSPEKIMEAYYGCMDQMCSYYERQLNSIHISAIVHGTTKVWAAAGARQSGLAGEQQAEQKLRDFIVRMLERLQPLLPAVRAPVAAGLLRSSARLGLNPDALVPGMTDSLGQQFMADMDAATGQDLAKVLAACAKLQLSPCQGELLKAIFARLAVADSSSFDSQHVASRLHSIGMVTGATPSIELIDSLCKRFGMLLKSCQADEVPNAHTIATTLSALSKLRYAPSKELAKTMVDRMVALCHVPGQWPTPQLVSIFLFACAELSVVVNQTDAESLVGMLLRSSRHWVAKRVIPATARSLAMLGCLHNQTFDRLIDQISSEVWMPSLLSTIDVYQLYQALDWLQPVASADAQVVDAWVCLKAKIGKLGPRPAPSTAPYAEAELVCAALTQLRLRFTAKTVISNYWVAAILEPSCSGSSIVLGFKAYQFLRTKPVRQVGREYFRQELLGRHGKLVLVDPLEAEASVKQLADHLEPILTAAAGGSLDAYRL